MITATPVPSVIEKLPPSQEDIMRVLAIKSASTTFKVGFGTCLNYKKADIAMAAAIMSTMIIIWQGKVILIRYY